MPQPPGLYGPLLYPTSTTGTAGLTLDFIVVHPVDRRGTLSPPPPATTRRHDCRRRWRRQRFSSCRRELLEVAPGTRATLPAPRRNVRSTPDGGGSAVQPPGLGYTAHWEALGCALCRPRARVPLVVWAWDLFDTRLPCCGLPAPARQLFFALRCATVCH